MVGTGRGGQSLSSTVQIHLKYGSYPVTEGNLERRLSGTLVAEVYGTFVLTLIGPMAITVVSNPTLFPIGGSLGLGFIGFAHGVALLVGIAAVGAIYTTAADLNLLLTGEQEAMHLGVNVTRVKLVVYLAASLLTGLAVSVSGAIGYVGLLVPHVMRLLFGSDYRLLIPTSALGGAIAIVLADTLARTIVAPTELPVGAMTAMAGAPVFIYLLRRRLP